MMDATHIDAMGRPALLWEALLRGHGEVGTEAALSRWPDVFPRRVRLHRYS